VGVSPSVARDVSEDGGPFAVPVATFGRGPGFNRIAFTADGKQLLALNLRRQIELWDVASQRCDLIPFQGSTIFDVACSPVDQRLAACGVDGVYLWNDARRDPVRISSRWFDKVEFMPNGERLLAAKNGVHSFDVRDSKSRQLGPVQTISSPFGFDGFSPSPDGKIVALTRNASTSTVVFAVEPAYAGYQEPLLQVPIRGRHSAMAWSPDGRFFAVAKDQGVLIFDRRTGRQMVEFAAPAPIASHGRLAFLHRGSLLFWANGAELHVFDVEAGQQRWYEREGPYNDFAVSPDGMTLAGCDYRGIKLWRIPQ
jgi:WD40 repeat protein